MVVSRKNITEFANRWRVLADAAIRKKDNKKVGPTGNLVDRNPGYYHHPLYSRVSKRIQTYTPVQPCHHQRGTIRYYQILVGQFEVQNYSGVVYELSSVNTCSSWHLHRRECSYTQNTPWWTCKTSISCRRLETMLIILVIVEVGMVSIFWTEDNWFIRRFKGGDRNKDQGRYQLLPWLNHLNWLGRLLLIRWPKSLQFQDQLQSALKIGWCPLQATDSEYINLLPEVKLLVSLKVRFTGIYSNLLLSLRFFILRWKWQVHCKYV